MSFSSDQVVFYLSGGVGNTEPSKSLGNHVAAKSVTPAINNLFTKVSRADANLGGIRYRCCYCFNESTSTITNCSIAISQDSALSAVTLGVEVANEVQMLVIPGISGLIGDSFTLTYTTTVGGIEIVQETSPIQYLLDPDAFSDSVADSLNALTYLSEVDAFGVVTSGTSYISVEFAGSDGKRAHDLLTTDEFTTRSILKGSPINAIASDIGFDNQPPSGVSFVNELSLGVLNPGDGFAVWLKRDVVPQTIRPNAVDSCNVQFSFFTN